MKPLRTWVGEASPAALVFACAVPLIFLHPHYQPSVSTGQVNADLTDFAILAAVLAGIWVLYRDGAAALRAGRWVWIFTAAFLVLALASVSWAHAADPQYAVGHNLISALKFAEYACLAPAAALVFRQAVDRRVLFWSVAAWASVLTFIAVLQFLGPLAQFRGHHPFDREPSYLGEHNFAAFSGMTLSFAFVSLLLARRRRLGVVGGVAGGLGVALAAALDAVGGMCITALALVALARSRTAVPAKRAVTVLALAAVVTGASFTLRGHAVVAFLRFVGIKPNTTATSGSVQTWGQRVLLGYIGVEIWVHHPLIGVGWQESMQPHSFEPTLAGARKHFASRQPPIAFPSPEHRWGVQNGIVQTLSDLGLAGLMLLAALVAALIRVAAPVARRGPPMMVYELLVATGWIVVGFAVFTGTGLLAGESVDAQLWIAVGLIVALKTSLTTDS